MQSTLFRLQPPTDLRLAERLRESAEALTSRIEEKRNPAIASQNPTARRARIAASMREDADRMEDVQNALNALAHGIEEDSLPAVLRGIRWSKAIVEWPVAYRFWPWRHPDSLIAAGIETEERFNAVMKSLLSMVPGRSQEDETARRIREMEADLIGRKIPGYFPTPAPVVLYLIEKADIGPDMKVLEPSAGKGDIAGLVRHKHPEADLSVIELNYDLREILKLKGFNVVGHDFFDHKEPCDLVVMNPPFENGQDIDHLRHAYGLLKPGGRVVSVMSEGPFFRRNRKSAEFREWLEDLGGANEPLWEDAFKKSGTGVRTRVVVLDKEG